MQESLKKRQELLRQLPPPLRHDICWKGPLLQVGSFSDKRWERERQIGFLVQKHYGPANAELTQLDDEDRAEFLSDKYDPEVLPLVERMISDFADPDPWKRFYSALHYWLMKVHEIFPIALFLRPFGMGDREDVLLEADRESVHKVLETVIPDICRLVSSKRSPKMKPPRWIVDFIQELMLYISKAPLGDAERNVVLPILPYAFGTDNYGTAAEKVLMGLTDEGLRIFINGRPAHEGLNLMLRTDFLPAFLKRDGFAEMLKAQLARFWSAAPENADIVHLAVRLQYALWPTRVTENNEQTFLTMIDELDANAHRYLCPKKFESLVSSFNNKGFASEARRLLGVVEKMYDVKGN